MKKNTKTIENYICEGCGKSHNDKYVFNKCAICGKEVCIACSVIKDLDCGSIESDDDTGNLTFYDNIYEHKYRLCHECATKYESQIDKINCKNYEEYIKLICKFNEDNEKLVKETLKKVKGIINE